MELLGWTLRSEDALKEIEKWSVLGGSMRDCPHLQDARDAYEWMVEKYNMPVQRIRDKMGRLSVGRVAQIAAFLQGKEIRGDELRESFEVKTLCSFYQAVMELWLSTNHCCNAKERLSVCAFLQVEKNARKLLELAGIKEYPSEILGVTVDAMVDAAWGIAERAKNPYTSAIEVAEDHHWKILRRPHKIHQSIRQEKPLPQDLKYETSAQNKVASQVNRVIIPRNA